jgi:hypothetical protein
MERKEGKYLVNSRVDIDYTKGKHKIKFSYPGKPEKDEKRQAVWNGSVLIIWLVIGVVPLIILSNMGKNNFQVCLNDADAELCKKAVKKYKTNTSTLLNEIIHFWLFSNKLQIEKNE